MAEGENEEEEDEEEGIGDDVTGNFDFALGRESQNQQFISAHIFLYLYLAILFQLSFAGRTDSGRYPWEKVTDYIYSCTTME